MKVYLVRHGEAVSEAADRHRPLSKKGIADTRKIAGHLKSLSVSADAVFHSGKKRAEETASIIAGVTGCRGALAQRENLLPDDDIDDMACYLKNSKDDVMVVGHLPFLSYLASCLLSGVKNTAFVEFQPSAVVCLEKRDNRFILNWAVNPDMIG
jgi:phosphohistidine phosphatase